ncbi:MAG: hypothetical protein HY558_02830 [Euryarchaeota archaeon]|nr:hypothetical protein [Euryarchaeota archaeon]
MRKRVYHLFPASAHIERRFRVSFGLDRVVRSLRSVDGASDTLETHLPDQKSTPVAAKREFHVEVTDRSVDFIPISQMAPADVEAEGTIDFRIRVRYGYLTQTYSRLPLKGDLYLLRADLRGGLLTLRLAHMEGLRRTPPAEMFQSVYSALQKARTGPPRVRTI